jgi:hypothetical protein
MKYPVPRDAGGVPIENHPDDGYRPEEPQFDENWEEGASAFPLAYAYPEDKPPSGYAAEQEAAEIEATLLSDLEAAATAFWTDLDPDEDSTRHRENPGPAEPDRASQFEFRWEPGPEEVVGPKPRRTLIAFRPPRARKRNDTGFDPGPRTVNFDIHATSDGAFADDLAARNKEFYDLLRSNSAARKIAVPRGPARGPGFETIFPRAEPPPHRHRSAQERRAGSGLAGQAAAASILAIVVGAGIFIIAEQFSIPATSDDVVASLPDGESASTAALVPTKDPSERAATGVANDGKPVGDPPAATLPAVDPGTLTTPPLYEKPEPASQSADLSDPAATAPEFAAIPLRTETQSAAPVETAPAASEPAPATLTHSKPENPPAPAAAVEPAATAEHEPAAVDPAAPPPAKETPGTTQMLRIPAGSGKVNTAVNMRAGPDNDAKVVRVLGAGTPVEIVNCKMWCEVIAGSARGYVFQRFINRTGGSARAAPVPDDAARTSLPEEAQVAPQEEARGPFNLLRFGRPNN